MIWVKQCTCLHRISFAILIPPLKAIAKYLEFFIHTQNSGRNWFYFLWTETSEFVPVLLRSERQLLFLTSPSIPQTAVSPGLLSLTSTTQRLTVLSGSFTVVNMLLCYFLHHHFQTETCFVWSPHWNVSGEILYFEKLMHFMRRVSIRALETHWQHRCLEIAIILHKYTDAATDERCIEWASKNHIVQLQTKTNVFAASYWNILLISPHISCQHSLILL